MHPPHGYGGGAADHGSMGEREREEIEHGDRRDLAAGFGTTTTVGSAEGSGREQRAGRQPTGVVAWGASRLGSAKENIRDQISISTYSPETGSHV
jgi:hypothetical protein